MRPIALSLMSRKRSSVSGSKTSGAMSRSERSALSASPSIWKFAAFTPLKSPLCNLVTPMRFIRRVRRGRPEKMSSGSSEMELRPKVRYSRSRYLKSWARRAVKFLLSRFMPPASVSQFVWAVRFVFVTIAVLPELQPNAP